MNTYENIPEELKNIDNWVLWKLQDRNGKKAKIPYSINGKMAKSNDKTTWGSFNKVVDIYNHSGCGYKGIGFEFSGSGITGIDIDHCIINGSMNELAKTTIELFNSYTEKSQSGEGIHILVKGSIPKGLHQEVEIYSEGRYFAITGDVIGVNNKIENRQEQLTELYNKYQKPIVINYDTSFGACGTDLLEKAFNSAKGSKIKALYDGDISAYDNDQSKADQALCNYLAFWFNKDFNEIDRVFKQSRLYRDKWDREDYKAWTINKAINDCKQTYQEYIKENSQCEFSVVEQEQEVEINYLYKDQNGKQKLNTGLLADFLRKNINYIIVRKQGNESEFLYWYEKGVYRRSSPNEFKGKIKTFIPKDIRRASQWEEVYKDLITDKTAIRFEDLDKADKYINVKNGLYNVKTCKLEPHNADILSTIQLNCNYDPQGVCSEWLSFINTLADGDSEIIAILQEWFGLTLSNIKGSITKKCLALYGTLGNTGKTQFLNMLVYLIGSDYICSTNIQDLSKPFATGDLYGAKAIIVDDQKSTKIDDSSIFKMITGGGANRCEQKGKQAFMYEFLGTLTFGCNDLPYFKGDKGDHLFERFIIIPCNNIIPKEQRICNIIELFKLEADGIFIWALEGLQRLIKNKYRVTESSRCTEALEEYKFANDSFYKFIKENYEITNNKKDRIRKTTLEAEYTQWAFMNEVQALDKKNISARALKHGIGYVKYCGNWVYNGIKKIDLSENNDNYQLFIAK